LVELQQLTALTSLSLAECGQLTAAGLTALHPLTGLTHLSLRMCPKLTDAGVAAALQRLTALTSLNLADS
jgi:hypothetical protein